MPRPKIEDTPRTTSQQVEFAYTTLLNRLDKLMIQVLETVEGYDADSETGSELRVIHAQLAELMTKNSRLRHRLQQGEGK